MGRPFAAAARVALSFELDVVALVPLVEDGSFDARRVKEQLLAARVANEAVASIPNDSRDRAGFRMLSSVIQDTLSRAYCQVRLLASTGSGSVLKGAEGCARAAIAVGIYASQVSSACREPYTDGAPNGAIGEAGEEQAHCSGLRSARPFSGDWPAWRWAHGHAER